MPKLSECLGDIVQLITLLQYRDTPDAQTLFQYRDTPDAHSSLGDIGVASGIYIILY